MTVEICTDCLEEFTGLIDRIKDVLNEKGETPDALQLFYSTRCPRRRCNGRVIEIEEDLIPLVQLLTAKGYPVETLRIGYPVYESTGVSWIEFQKEVKEIPEIPDFWDLGNEMVHVRGLLNEDDDDEELPVMITSITDEEDQMEFYESVCHEKIELMRWAKELPTAEDVAEGRTKKNCLKRKENNILYFPGHDDE